MLLLITKPETDQIWDWVKFIFLEYWPLLLNGMMWTLIISLSATLIGLVIAMVITPFKIQNITCRDSLLIKVLKKISSILTTIYVEVLRGTPMIVQAVIIYFGLLSGHIDVITSGIFIVAINTSAYITEVLRGSISSIDKGQMEAARSLGMTRLQAMFLIIIPQALKNSIPSIGNEFVINIKDTAVLNVIAVTELFFVTDQINGTYYRSYEGYIITAVLYLIMTFTTTRLLYLISSKIGDKKIRSFPTSQSI
ncbi:MAG: transporter permease subunit [Haloplasmataceae bacterium]|nr:transporter permease subunit [Haloplasmataceae bacterium]